MDDVIRQVLEQKHGLRLARRLGRGGFAEVWEAQASGGVPCAVKISLDPIDEQNETVRKELENLQLVQQIGGHPRVLTLMDYWVIGGHLVTRWELAREGTLLDKLHEYQQRDQQGIPPEVLLPWMEQAAEGIDFLNSQGIYHRDIKPQNLLLFHNQVKLADLGLVKFAGLSTVSHTGSGTLGYLPPEAYQDHRLSPTLDLYSLAATYVKLRTGREPFGEDPLRCAQNQLQGNPQLDGLPGAEAALLRQALSPEPQKRPREGCSWWPSFVKWCFSKCRFRLQCRKARGEANRPRVNKPQTHHLRFPVINPPSFLALRRGIFPLPRPPRRLPSWGMYPASANSSQTMQSVVQSAV